MKERKANFAAQLERDKPVLARLNARIAKLQASRDQGIEQVDVALQGSDDFGRREGALGKLAFTSAFFFAAIWGLRIVWLIFDLFPQIAKLAAVKKGTAATKAEEADENERILAEDWNNAQTAAQRRKLEKSIEHFDVLVDLALQKKMERLLEDLENEAAKPHLRVVRDEEGAVPESGGGHPADHVQLQRTATVDELETLERQLTQSIKVARKSLPGFEDAWPIGNGGSAQVWIAYDQKLGIKVAIKILGDKDGDFDYVERELMAGEAETLRKLRHHPHVVQLLYETEILGAPALVLEHVRGISLQAAMDSRRGGRFSVEEMLTVMLPICGALQALHGSAGMLHLDLKPLNILGWGSGDARRITLIDFHVTSPINAVPRFRVGTPGYASPEQIAMEKLDERADIYACGVLMFEMISGERLFPRDGNGSWTPERPPSAAEIYRYTANTKLAKLIADCISYDRERRPRNANELSGGLLEAIGEIHPPSRPAYPDNDPTPRYGLEAPDPESGEKDKLDNTHDQAGPDVVLPESNEG